MVKLKIWLSLDINVQKDHYNDHAHVASSQTDKIGTKLLLHRYPYKRL